MHYKPVTFWGIHWSRYDDSLEITSPLGMFFFKRRSVDYEKSFDFHIPDLSITYGYRKPDGKGGFVSGGKSYALAKLVLGGKKTINYDSIDEKTIITRCQAGELSITPGFEKTYYRFLPFLSKVTRQAKVTYVLDRIKREYYLPFENDDVGKVVTTVNVFVDLSNKLHGRM